MKRFLLTGLLIVLFTLGACKTTQKQTPAPQPQIDTTTIDTTNFDTTQVETTGVNLQELK